MFARNVDTSRCEVKTLILTLAANLISWVKISISRRRQRNSPGGVRSNFISASVLRWGVQSVTDGVLTLSGKSSASGLTD